MLIRSPWKFACALALAASTALVGCSTINPYTGQQHTSSLVKGSAIGAAGGAAIGALSGHRHRGKRALIGAAIGAIAGGGVGYYMDVQEAKLRQKMAGTGVSVTRQGDDIVLNMPGNVTFATNSADLRPQFFKVLNGVAMVLNEYEKTLVMVTGYTDSTGAASYNQQLSLRRAQSVASYLQSQGVKTVRIVTQGMGESNPIASNATAQGRQQNRRVELRLQPITQADVQ